MVDAAKYELGSPTVFFYCETENQTELSASNLLSSFIRQLYGYICRDFRSYLESVAKDITKFFGHKRVQPDLDDLKAIFTLCFRGVPNAVYVIDGLDALDREHGKFIMELFKSLLPISDSQNGARILLLSRDQVPGYINISTFIPGIRQISTSANIMKDISTYIESSITDKTMCRTLTDDHLLIEEIKQRLLSESSGMYGRSNTPPVDYKLTGTGFYGCISSWRFSGTRAIQMRKYDRHCPRYPKALKRHIADVLKGSMKRTPGLSKYSNGLASPQGRFTSRNYERQSPLVKKIQRGMHRRFHARNM